MYGKKLRKDLKITSLDLKKYSAQYQFQTDLKPTQTDCFDHSRFRLGWNLIQMVLIWVWDFSKLIQSGQFQFWPETEPNRPMFRPTSLNSIIFFIQLAFFFLQFYVCVYINMYTYISSKICSEVQETMQKVFYFFSLKASSKLTVASSHGSYLSLFQFSPLNLDYVALLLEYD